jgi:phage shock protein PspC (stress-responsive transcriptional regulator)
MKAGYYIIKNLILFVILLLFNGFLAEAFGLTMYGRIFPGVICYLIFNWIIDRKFKNEIEDKIWK